MTQYQSQVISPIQIGNNIRIIAIPRSRTGAARHTVCTGAGKRAGAAHRTKTDYWFCDGSVMLITHSYSTRNIDLLLVHASVCPALRVANEMLLISLGLTIKKLSKIRVGRERV